LTIHSAIGDLAIIALDTMNTLYLRIPLKVGWLEKNLKWVWSVLTT